MTTTTVGHDTRRGAASGPCEHLWGFAGRVSVEGRTYKRVGRAKAAVARALVFDSISAAEAIAVGCEQPYRIACRRGCGASRLARCGLASERSCVPCAHRARGRVGRVARDGLRGMGAGLFVTLTAPTWKGHVHVTKTGRDRATIDHRRRCDCTGGGCSDLAAWNATAGKRWNRFVQDLRRALGPVEYFKAAEVQRRGALHFHVLAAAAPGCPPLSLTWGKLRELAVKHGFGHEVDVQHLTDVHEDRAGCPCVRCRAGYVAKYASKAAAQRTDVPWKGRRRMERVDRTTGEITKGWAPSMRPTYRTWTASRRWNATMAEVKAAQAHHSAVLDSLLPWGDRSPWPADADRCPRRPDRPSTVPSTAGAPPGA